MQVNSQKWKKRFQSCLKGMLLNLLTLLNEDDKKVLKDVLSKLSYTGKVQNVHRVNSRVNLEGKPRLLKFKVDSQKSKKEILTLVRNEGVYETEYHELFFSSDFTFNE